MDNTRVLVADDSEQVHRAFQAILMPGSVPREEMAELGFGDDRAENLTRFHDSYTIDFATQGQEALAKIQIAKDRGQPYALAFVDARMPPGWNGIHTIRQAWMIDPDIQMVIMTAYSDYSWDTIHKEFGDTSSLLFIRKPLDITEVRQLASMLVIKWNMSARAQLKMEQLEELVQLRTKELEEAMEELERRKDAEIEAKRLQVVEQLAVTVAHEFNNPLAVIQGSVQAVLMKKGSDEQREKLISKIPKQIDRMTELVQKLIKLKSLDVGDYAIGIKFLDLHGETNTGNGHGKPGFSFPEKPDKDGGVIEERPSASEDAKSEE